MLLLGVLFASYSKQYGDPVLTLPQLASSGQDLKDASNVKMSGFMVVSVSLYDGLLYPVFCLLDALLMR